MADKALPSPEVLRQLLTYDPATGRFFWRHRTPDSVQCERESTRVRICKNWNARYSGKETFNTVSARGYYVGSVSCRHFYAHRVAWAMTFGAWPDGEIDHINGDPLDNRIANLRAVGRMENGKNLSVHRRNKTGYHGVWWDKSRGNYQVYITSNQKRKSLGRFTRLEDAIEVRQKAEREAGFHPNHGRAKTIR